MNEVVVDGYEVLDSDSMDERELEVLCVYSYPVVFVEVILVT